MSDQPDVQVEVKKAPQTMLVTMAQLAGVIGVGSVIGLYVVPKMVSSNDRKDTFIQQQMFQQSQASATALNNAADSMDDLRGDIKGLVGQQHELLEGLAPLTHQLDRVADAVRDKIEQDQQAAKEAK